MQTELGSSKERTMRDKKCSYMSDAERKSAGIPSLTMKPEGG